MAADWRLGAAYAQFAFRRRAHTQEPTQAVDFLKRVLAPKR